MSDTMIIDDGGGGGDPGGGGGGWTATGWIPAFDGYSYVGNGVNDLFNYLPEGARSDGRLSQEEIDYAVAQRGEPLNDIDALALAHDRGIIDPETGLEVDTFGHVLNDLGLTVGSIEAFFNDPIGNIAGLATAAFGILAAGYHILEGLAQNIIDGVRNIVTSIADAIGRLFDPIVLDLDGDGFELVSLQNSTARFDVDDDGVSEQIGWAGADDGILAFDANQSGSVDAAREISFVGYKAGAQTDLAGLAAFDANGDGLLTEADSLGGEFDWSQFMIWRDANQNGRSDTGELVTLTDAGIVSIDLFLNGDASEVDGNYIHNTTTFVRADGSVGQGADVSFAVETGAAPVDNREDLVDGKNDRADIVGGEQELRALTASGRDERIIFSEASDDFVWPVENGHDLAVFIRNPRAEDLRLFDFEADEISGISLVLSDETALIITDVEVLSSVGRLYDVGDAWA